MNTVPVLSTQTIGGPGSFAVRPKGMIWADAEGNLVPNGHENASVKVSNGVDTLPLHEVQRFPNYRDHFEPVNAQDSFPPAGDPEEVAIQEAVRPKRGRPAKVVTDIPVA